MDIETKMVTARTFSKTVVESKQLPPLMHRKALPPLLLRLDSQEHLLRLFRLLPLLGEPNGIFLIGSPLKLCRRAPANLLAWSPPNMLFGKFIPHMIPCRRVL